VQAGPRDENEEEKEDEYSIPGLMGLTIPKEGSSRISGPSTAIHVNVQVFRNVPNPPIDNARKLVQGELSSLLPALSAVLNSLLELLSLLLRLS
jgi:hypothetical protein